MTRYRPLLLAYCLVSCFSFAGIPAKPSAIWSVKFSPDGALLAVGVYQNVIVYDAKTRKVKGTLEGMMDAVRGLDFSRNGKYIAVAGGLPTEVGEVVIWDAKTLEHVADINDHTDVVEAVAINPQGTLVVSSSSDEKVMVNRVEDGELLAIMGDHVKRVFAAAFSPDGKYFATGSADRTIKNYEAKDHKLLINFSQSGGAVNGLAFSKSGTTLVSGCADSRVRTWMLTHPSEKGKKLEGRLLRVYGGHTGPVNAVDFHPDGEHIISAGEDKTVILWHVPSGNIVRKFYGASDQIYSVAISPDGKTLAAGGRDGKLRLWDTQSGKQVLDAFPPTPKPDAGAEEPPAAAANN